MRTQSSTNKIMSGILQSILAISILCLGVPATAKTTDSATTTLKPFTANYALTKKNIVIAKVRMSLSAENKQWKYSSTATAAGLAAMFKSGSVQETTTFDLVNGAIVPQHYHYSRTGKSDKNIDIHFDWQNMTASVHTANETSQVTIEPGILDPLAMQLALMLDLKAGKQQTAYTVLDGTERKSIEFTPPTQEPIKVSAGHFKTLKVIRQHGSRETMGWYATEANYLPVQIQRFRKGKLKTQLALGSFDFQ